MHEYQVNRTAWNSALVRTLAKFVNDKQQYTGANDAECDYGHYLPGHVSNTAGERRDSAERTDCVFHPVCTMATRLLYLFTVSEEQQQQQLSELVGGRESGQGRDGSSLM